MLALCPPLSPSSVNLCCFPCTEPVAGLCGRHREQLLLSGPQKSQALKRTFSIVVEKDKNFSRPENTSAGRFYCAHSLLPTSVKQTKRTFKKNNIEL